MKTQYKSLSSPCGAVKTVREQWNAMDMMWNECATNKNECTNKNQMCANGGYSLRSLRPTNTSFTNLCSTSTAVSIVVWLAFDWNSISLFNLRSAPSGK